MKPHSICLGSKPVLGVVKLRRSSMNCHRLACLQLSQDPLGTARRNGPAPILLGVGNLPVVDDDGVSQRPVVTSPADALAELESGVRSKDLSVVRKREPKGPRLYQAVEVIELTMKSSATPFALPHALMTKASLLAMKTTFVTPLDLSLSMLLMYEGTCCSWHVGVKAPGTATRTTLPLLNSAGRPRQHDGGGSGGARVAAGLPLLASYLIGTPQATNSFFSGVYGM